MKDLKESNPVEIAEFATARGIKNEPAFSWWIPYMLQKRDAILLAIKMQVQKTTHKYGVKILSSVDHAKEIDRANGNHMW